MSTPSFASASGTGTDLGELLGEIASRTRESLGPGDPPDAAFLFVTPDFGAAVAEAGVRARRLTGARHLLGCTGAGVIETEAEREGGHAASLLLARLPGAVLRPFHLGPEAVSEMTTPEEVRRRVGVPAEDAPVLFLLPEPFTTDAEGLLAALDEGYPGRPVLGGLASGAPRPGLHSLWLDGRTHASGAVGLAMSGEGAAVRPLVSQGCRPIGRRYAVTRAEGNRLFTLAGRPAADALKETVEALGPEDRRLARTSLHLGRVAHEASPEFHRGDFLIRNLVALVPEDGSLVVGDQLRVGQTVQFQLRDAATATEDLAELLEMEGAVGRPRAALLFSCGGRGSHLFGEPDHDIALVRRKLGEFPLAGFFCNGEIGPVGPRNFLHGFTSSLALFGTGG